MTLQNRVMPDGSIVAHPARGTLTGNRGILHDDERRLGTARWRHAHWISCELEFRSRKRNVMTPGQYTELFFLDEAVALAAGHRPCAECRRADYRRFADAWERATGQRASAGEIDRALHKARVDRTTRLPVTHEESIASLPDGCFIRHHGQPCLVRSGQVLPFTPQGYLAPASRPRGGSVTVMTPRPLVAVLAAGYCPRLHPSAR